MCQLYKDDDLLMLNKTLNLKTAILGESKMGETFFSAIRKKYIDMNVLGVYHAASCVLAHPGHHRGGSIGELERAQAMGILRLLIKRNAV